MPFFLLTFLTPWESQCVVDRLCQKLVYIFYEWLILMTGSTSVALSATIMPDILKTIYMKQKQNETIFGWWLWK